MLLFIKFSNRTKHFFCLYESYYNRQGWYLHPQHYLCSIFVATALWDRKRSPEQSCDNFKETLNDEMRIKELNINKSDVLFDIMHEKKAR